MGYEILFLISDYDRKMHEHARAHECDLPVENRRCPRCRKGYLDEWTGICNNCGYPETV